MSSKASSSKKRLSSRSPDARAAKAPKLFPIFDGKAKANPDALFRWISPSLGPKRTCLHGVNGTPKSLPKVAAFDLDGCIIESSFPKLGTPPQFKWWRHVVPKKIQEAHNEGYAIVIITNQALKTQPLINDWKKKIPLIASALAEVPFRLFAATAKDGYRKPIPGMWYELERIFKEDGVDIDIPSSYFVGDAAGRKGDHSSTDLKLALNIGLPFFTPEEYFLGLEAAPYTMPGFNVSSLPTDLPHLVPDTPPLPTSDAPAQELVLFVGYPALGKTSFFRTHFAPAGYAHINQDTLKTRDKCVQAVDQALKEGRSCVVDNTNRDVTTRAHYMRLAKKHKVPARCVLFNGSIDLAWHNNLYRAYNLPPALAQSQPARELLPYLAFANFRTGYEEPTIEEGFTEIRQVNWVFEGDEEARRRWSMWLQIDGK